MPASSPDTSSDTDLFTYYSALSTQFFSSDASNHAQSDDPLRFLDDSLFFVNQIEPSQAHPFAPPGLQGSPSNSAVASMRENKRVAFSTRLNDCHQHRMSTIIESPAIEELPTKSVAPLPSPETFRAAEPCAPEPLSRSGSTKSKQVSWAMQTPYFEERPEPSPYAPPLATGKKPDRLIPPKAGFRKLLDYIMPYPTRPPPKKRRRSGATTAPARILTPILPAVVARTSDATSSSEDSSRVEDDWVIHGFFEIRRSERP